MATVSVESDSSGYKRRIEFKFDNGLTLSIAFGIGTYSSNKDATARDIHMSSNMQEFIENVETVETAVLYGKMFVTKYVLREVEDDVEGYVNVSRLPDIIKRVKDFNVKYLKKTVSFEEISK